jgi:hypothetical protein
MIFYDKETCGFTGPTVLDQWAEDRGPVHIHNVWLTPVKETLSLYEWLATQHVCAFNMTFDWYHLIKDYNILRHASDRNKVPLLKEYLANQERGVREALCLKPEGALDLYLHAIQGPLQSLMARDSTAIRKVPTQCAQALADHLTKEVDIAEIFFHHGRKDGKRWMVYPWVDKETMEEDENFKDVVLKFAASGALKPLIAHIFGTPTMDLPVPDHLKPKDNKTEWYPFHHKSRWDLKLRGQVHHWSKNATALRYAAEDIEHLQNLHEYFNYPETNDDNSYLVSAVAWARWKGFAFNTDKAKIARAVAEKEMQSAPRSPGEAMRKLQALMSPIERITVTNTSGPMLEAIGEWPDHPAAELAKSIHRARSAATRVNLLSKMIEIGRSHPDFKIIGTRSSRMAGTGGINMTGIDSGVEVRECYEMADEGEQLDGGDFSGYEVSIAAAVYKDPRLNAELASGKKLHGMFGALAYEKEYDEIMDTKLEGLDGLYGKAKSGVFALFYGAMEWKLASTLGIPVERAAELVAEWAARYPMWDKARQATFLKFCSMRQPGGIGSPVIWHEPADYCETMLGFKRYFTLENSICKALFKLGQRVPPELRRLGAGFRVKRRDRVQTALGATQSALFGAAFQIQAQNMRSAGNHEIQSMGGQCTKKVQRALWDQQPCGVHPGRLRIMQVHDEIEVVHDGTVDTAAVVQGAIEDLHVYIPTLQMEWKTHLESWADVK